MARVGNNRERLMPGDAAPWFTVRSIKNQRFHIDTAAGRYLLLYFAGSLASNKAVAQALAGLEALFNGVHAALFVASADPADEAGAYRETPGIKYF